MKKPVHWFAFVLWVLAAVFFIVEIVLMFNLPHRSVDPNVALFSLWASLRTTLTFSLTLAALGLLIEMVDRIWWRGLSPEEQVRDASRAGLLSIVRRWPSGPDR